MIPGELSSGWSARSQHQRHDLVRIECNADGVSVACLGGGSNTGGHLVALVLQVQVDLSAHHFGHIDLSLQVAVGGALP